MAVSASNAGGHHPELHIISYTNLRDEPQASSRGLLSAQSLSVPTAPAEACRSAALERLHRHVLRAVVALVYPREEREVTRPLSRTTCSLTQLSTWAEAPHFPNSGVAEVYRSGSSNRDVDNAEWVLTRPRRIEPDNLERCLGELPDCDGGARRFRRRCVAAWRASACRAWQTHAEDRVGTSVQTHHSGTEVPNGDPTMTRLVYLDTLEEAHRWNT